MNSDTNLAAWMIAGGPRATDPAEAREESHRRALAAVRRTVAGPSLATRISAALSALRSPRTEPDPACCPA